MKKTKLLSLVLAFLLILTSSVWVFAEETQPVNLMTDEMVTLRDNIADVIKDVEDGWTAMDMAAYATIPDTTIRMSDATKQKVLNSCIQGAQVENVSASDQARIEIVLKSIGIDSSELYSLNSDTPFDNGAALKNANHTAGGHYAAPWILIADILGNVNLSEEQKTSLIDVLNTNSSDGTFGYEWEGVSYPDYDTAAVVLTAVAPVYSTNDTAKTMADEIILSLENNIAENGSFGSANTDAMVIIGYIAMGKNPQELKHPVSEKTVIDGLMSYVNESNNGFTFYGLENYLATEQGFRALVALSNFSGTTYNIYDFSENTTVAGRETSDQEEGEILPPPEEETGFTVTLTVETKDEKWIDNASVLVEEGATVYDAFVSAISSAGMSQEGAENGYVRSITKDGVTLSEFGNGKNSGWLYKVNGTKSTVGLKSYTIYENDEIVWYYVEDWKTSGGITNGYGGGYGGSGGGSSGGSSGGSGGGSGSSKEDNKDVEEIPEEVPEEIPEEIPIKVFADTQNHWASEAVSYVTTEGIMKGISDDEFAPDEKLTRAMLVTMLYRLSGDVLDGNYTEFTDVSEDAWYTEAVNWAVKSGITDGMGDGTFGADVPVTREQLALFLMRYANLCEVDTTVDDIITDNETSQWAQEAVSWANKTGLISGYDNGSLYPKNNATRAEIATVFMRYIENIIK